MKNKAKFSTLALAILGMAITGCENKSGCEMPPKVDNITSITLDRYYASMFCNTKGGDDSFNEEEQKVVLVHFPHHLQ